MSKRQTWGITLVSLVFLGSLLTLGLYLINHQNRALPEVPLQTLEGEPLQLEAYLGKPLLVNVWATWCPPCVREMPLLSDLAASHEDLQVVLVNHGEGPATIKSFMQEQGLTHQQLLLDARGGLLEHSGHRGLPVTYFYDAQGRLVATHSGELTVTDLAEQLPRMGVVFDPQAL